MSTLTRFPSPIRVPRSTRPRILFVSQSLPFPPHSGVTARTYHILQQLQREFDVTLVAFSRRNHQPDENALHRSTQALREEVTSVLDPVRIESEWSLAAKLRVHARSLITNQPYTFFDYGNAEFADHLRSAIDLAQPDLVHLDSMDLYRWLGMLPEVPIACTHHNVESDLLRLRASRIRGAAKRRYIARQADLVESVERELCSKFDLNIMTSDSDAARMRALAPDARFDVVPNGVNVDFFRPTSTEKAVAGRVVFLGPTYMFPNRDAVRFFLDAIWPFVKKGYRQATLDVVGKNGAGDKENFEKRDGVSCRGYVADIRPSFAEAECSVVPLRVGGGTRLKILDAWAMGKAIVSTSIGCEGLKAIDGENILIRDDPRDFAAAVVRVLRDDAFRNTLGRNARKTAEEIYAWPVVGRTQNALYRDLLAVRPTVTARVI